MTAPAPAPATRRRPVLPVRWRQLLAALGVLAVVLPVAPAAAVTAAIDWADRPTTPIELPEGWSVVACEGDAPLLCATEGDADPAVVEHLPLPLPGFPELQQDLAAGVPPRVALAAEADRFHAVFREDRQMGCPAGWTYAPLATRGAVVGGLPGITYGFTVTDVDGRLVEHVRSWMGVREDGQDGVVDIVTANELNAGACLGDEGTQPFREGGLGRFAPSLAQLVARSTFGPGSAPAPRAILDGRMTADDAVGASVALSALAIPDGGAATALLARDDLFADALASGGAQGLRDAPLLLTGGDALDPRVAAELDRLGTTAVVVLGGEAAVAPTVVDALEADGIAVQRLAGPDRIGTAVALAREVAPTARRAVLVRADGTGSQETADALAAGSLAAVEGVAVLLTPTASLDPRVAGYLQDAGVEEVVLAGGEAALSPAVATALDDLGIAVDRAAGDERAGTATAVAARRDVPTAGYADVVVLVDGGTWVDGLLAAGLGLRSLAPIVLADGASLPPATRDFLAGADPTQPPTLLCMPSVLPAACDAAVSDLAGGDPVEPS